MRIMVQFQLLINLRNVCLKIPNRITGNRSRSNSALGWSNGTDNVHCLEQAKNTAGHKGRRTIRTRHCTAQDYGIPRRHDGRKLKPMPAPNGATFSLFMSFWIAPSRFRRRLIHKLLLFLHLPQWLRQWQL